MKLTGNILWTALALLCGGWSGIALDRLQAPDTTAGPGTYGTYLLPALIPILGNVLSAWLKRKFNIALPLPSPPRQSVAPAPARAAGDSGDGLTVSGSTLTIIDPIGTVTITLTKPGNADHQKGLELAGQLIEHYRGAAK